MGDSRLPVKSVLRWLPGKKPTLFSTNYTTLHRLSVYAQNVINDVAHPRHYAVKRKAAAMRRDILWWSPQVTLATSAKRTVRSWCTRRLRAAFTTELAARGLNKQGQRVRDGAAAPGPAAVSGTLLMLVNDKMIAAGYERVCEEAAWTVDALLAAAAVASKMSCANSMARRQFVPGKGRPPSVWR